MFILNQQNSLANHFLAEIRDVGHQQDRLRFRKNLERLGEIMAYEVSKAMPYDAKKVTSPFKEIELDLLKEQPILISVLRASLPFFQGFLNFFDKADSGFIGAFRKAHEIDTDNEVEIDLKYLAAPSIEGKIVIIIDPMLATGKSFIKSLGGLLDHGTPAQIEIVTTIAAPEGLAYIKENLKLPHRCWTCALDEKLNAKSYIIPGLGDAGDLAYGPKL